MIVVRSRGFGDVAYPTDAIAGSVSLPRSIDPRYSALVPPSVIADPRTQRVIATSQQTVAALTPQCSAGCAEDTKISADPDALSRCISICSSTGDLDTAKRNASRGAFCRQVIDAISPALGGSLRGDYQTLFEQCQADPDAFLGDLRARGIDLGVSFEPWFKRNWKLVTIGGAALVGLLVLRKLRR